jgi:hypothetical protein
MVRREDGARRDRYAAIGENFVAGAGKGIKGGNGYLPPSGCMPEISIPTVYGAVQRNGYDFQKEFASQSLE